MFENYNISGKSCGYEKLLKNWENWDLQKAFVYQDLLASFCIHITIVFCLQMQTRIKYIKIDLQT